MIKQGENPYFVRELETGYVVLNGVVRLAAPCTPKYMEEMSLVAEAAMKAFGAEKMNYELLGNGAAHLHWHLFSRRTGDLGKYGNNSNGPVWWYPWQEMCDDINRPSDVQLAAMKNKLRLELGKNISKTSY